MSFEWKIYDAVKDYDEIKQVLYYVENFDRYYKLLIKRYEHIKEINNSNSMDLEVITYLHMIVVQLRAMCIENPKYKHNYTLQNMAILFGKDDIANYLDTMLNQDMFPDMPGFSIREALKTLADKYICHYDKITAQKDLELAEKIEEKLLSQQDGHNFDEIISVLIKCIGNGLLIKFVKNCNK